MDLIGQKYRIIEECGEESENSFYRVVDETDGKHYYLDLIRTDSPSLSAKGLIELQVRAQEHSHFRHSNAIPFYPPEVTDNGLILIQNDIPGKSLNYVMKTRGRPLPQNQAYRITYAVVSALAAMHDLQMTHGELDSGHILINDSGDSFISFLPLPDDFNTQNALYRFPETESTVKSKFSDDIYAMGVILTEMFTSLIPFGFAENKDGKKNTRAFEYYKIGLAQISDESNEAIIPVILRCLNPDPKNRYENAVELFIDIRKIIEAWVNNTPGQENILVLPVIKKPIDQKEEDFENKIKKPSSSSKERVRSQRKSNKKKGSLLISFISAAIVITGGIVLFFYLSEVADTKTSVTNYQGTLENLNNTQTALAYNPAIITPQATKKSSSSIKKTAIPTPLPTFTLTITATFTPVPIQRSIGAVIHWTADQSEMVFVPSGNFQMGMDATFGFAIENLFPVHEVYLDNYWIDRTEVTFEQYGRCVKTGACPASEAASPITADQKKPVTGISWENAAAYCKWAGKRLPTEAEWEKAARGTDLRLYPWGNDSPQYTDQGNWFSTEIQNADEMNRDISPYGAIHMSDNVSEWVNDFFSPTFTTATEYQNPQGPVSGALRTVKGGAATNQDPEIASFVFNRWSADPIRPQDYGFRCAVSDSDQIQEKADGSEKPVPISPLGTIPETGCENRIGFVSDITIPDGTPVHANEIITKTWRLKNIGTCTITKNYKIVWADTTFVNPQKLFDFNTEILPGEEKEVSITFPVIGNGKTRINFKFAGLDGVPFQLGERGRGAFWIEYVIQ